MEKIKNYIVIMIHDSWTIKKLIPMAEKFLQEVISADILLFFHTHIFSPTLSIW